MQYVRMARSGLKVSRIALGCMSYGALAGGSTRGPWTRRPPSRSSGRPWQRIILGTALMHHLRKRINAQRFRLSNYKAGALRTELRPHALMSIVLYSKTRKNTGVARIMSLEIAQR
jgi:hypothetical protein